MKLEVGMYVRTDDGYMNKIKKVNQFNVLVYGRDLFGEELNIPNNEIKKASYNIIDILEVGDYVNGYKVEKVNNNLSEHKGICNSLDTYLWGINDLDEFEKIVIFEIDIKSVVTKEQFEQMTYKVGEQR
jgi:hypothetical protein